MSCAEIKQLLSNLTVSVCVHTYMDVFVQNTLTASSDWYALHRGWSEVLAMTSARHE